MISLRNQFQPAPKFAARPANAQPFSHSGGGAAEKTRERILIVDDEDTVLSLFSCYFSERYDCATATSVKDALELLAKVEFSCVLTDVIMPGLSGIELLRKVVELYPETQVVMVSGVNQPQRALDAMRQGAFDYLIKPCELDVMSVTVERALERRTFLRNARLNKLELEARNEELAHSKLELEARNEELAQEKAKLERLQAQIVHSEKMASLGQLAAGIAHELNNPVGFIYGNLEILDESVTGLKALLAAYAAAELSDADAARVETVKENICFAELLADLDSIVEDCRDGAERIRNIVQNLRTFSRLDEAELKKSDVHEGIDSTVRLLSRYYSADNVTLEKNYGELPPIDAFAAQLNQVWMNLLVNAAQAVGSAGGRVKISTRRAGDSIVVAVSDTGCGIAEDNLKRIFDPFFTTKPVGEGTGLGLSISFGIVEKHGGSIAVESKLNAGSTFTVTLPVNCAPDAGADNQVFPEPFGGGQSQFVEFHSTNSHSSSVAERFF